MAVSVIEVEKALAGMHYPASKEELLRHAKDKGVSKEIISMLEEFPERMYKNAADVAKAYGEVR